MTKPTNKEGWEERFDKIYRKGFFSNEDIKAIRIELVNLISNLLAETKSTTRRETLDEAIETIKRRHEQMLTLYGGKLPFVVFEGKADEKEKITLYEQGIKDTLSALSKLK